MSQEHSLADPLGPLAEEFVDRFRKGERPSLSEYIEKYPELAGIACVEAAGGAGFLEGTWISSGADSSTSKQAPW